MNNRNPRQSLSSQGIIHFRSLSLIEGHSQHFLAALQLIAHAVSPLRKALIQFYLIAKNHPGKVLEKIEWKTLFVIGKILKELITPPIPLEDDENDDDEEEDEPPVDPTELYQVLEACLEHFKKTKEPKDATEALQILLESIQRCARALPLTSHLWVAMLDEAGLGLMARANIVGKCPLIEDDLMLQRTQKETILEWCPVVLPKRDSLEDALKDHCFRRPHTYDFDTKPYQFEVRIPLFQKPDETVETSDWTTTITLSYTTLTSYLFFGIDRYHKVSENKKGKFDGTCVEIPKILNLTKYCEKNLKGSKEYQLVGGVLHDEGDYVALIKNLSIEDPDDEDAWKLMESEEIIPMTESDALDFLGGEDEDTPCGTVLVYQRCGDQTEMKQLLSDIIISQVSGTLDAEHEVYYEEEVIEE